MHFSNQPLFFKKIEKKFENKSQAPQTRTRILRRKFVNLKAVKPSGKVKKLRLKIEFKSPYGSVVASSVV